MARLRKAAAYRRIERAYTRTSKFRQKAYIRARPANHLVHYVMGNLKGEFDTRVLLRAKESVQIRDNALESARQVTNRFLSSKLGSDGYQFKVRQYPHHILRENPLATGAGADRMSTGMKMSFGKTIGIASRTRAGKVIFEIQVPKAKLDIAKQALKRANFKLPTKCGIEVA